MIKHEIATPNLVELGLEMQDKIVEGYRLDEGYPFQIGYLYVAHMTKAETVGDAVKMLATTQEQFLKDEPAAQLKSEPAQEAKRPGRPAKAK